MALGRDLIVFVGPGIGHLIDIVLPDVEVFDCRLGRFHASRMRRTVWKDLEITEANGNKRKLSGFHSFVFKFRLF